MNREDYRILSKATKQRDWDTSDNTEIIPSIPKWIILQV
jgi:hypothetical protein